jgi:LCP family protein required for cell wall assembly
MVASLNTKTSQTALLSIPRDLYAENPETKTDAKINTIYQTGLSQYPDDYLKAARPIIKTVENITSLKIDYWVVLNFQGFREVIDAVGGINITNERDIFDPRYPGPNYSYETFKLDKGFQHLDGATALKYARMRHDAQGDFGRAHRQQQVIQATKNKIFSTGTFLDPIALNKLFNALGENMKTNIKPSEFGDFLELIKKTDTENINNAVIDAWNENSLLIVSHVFYGDTRSFVLVPRIGSWKEIQELAKNIFDLNFIEKRRTEIAAENASVIIINKSGTDLALKRIEALFKENFGYKNIAVIYDRNKNLEELTSVYDLSDGKKPFTLDEIAKKLPARIQSDTENNYKKDIQNITADLAVIIGKDAIENYKMEKDSFSEYNNSADTDEYTEFINNN